MVSLSSQAGLEMSEQESLDALSSADHGVLSLGVDDRGYGFPISYALDEEEGRIVFGFVNRPGSKKREFADATEEATFTVFAYEDVDSWESVIVSGAVRPLDESDGPHRVPDLFFQRDDDADGDGEMANLDQFDRTWYELRIETVSGRRSGRA